MDATIGLAGGNRWGVAGRVGAALEAEGWTMDACDVEGIPVVNDDVSELLTQISGTAGPNVQIFLKDFGMSRAAIWSAWAGPADEEASSSVFG